MINKKNYNHAFQRIYALIGSSKEINGLEIELLNSYTNSFLPHDFCGLDMIVKAKVEHYFKEVLWEFVFNMERTKIHPMLCKQTDEGNTYVMFTTPNDLGYYLRNYVLVDCINKIANVTNPVKTVDFVAMQLTTLAARARKPKTVLRRWQTQNFWDRR